MNKALPIIVVIFFALCSETLAQRGRKETKSGAESKELKDSKSSISNEKSAKIEPNSSESTTKLVSKAHDDGVTFVIEGTTGALIKLSDSLKVESTGAFTEPIILVPHLAEAINKKFWFGLVDHIKESQIPIRNIVITEPNKTDNPIAIAVNSPEGVRFLEETKLFSKPYSVVIGYENLSKAKEINVYTANQKYSLSKLVQSANVKFLPGEYGPMKVDLNSDGTIKQ
jgi:hypothetical protein